MELNKPNWGYQEKSCPFFSWDFFRGAKWKRRKRERECGSDVLSAPYLTNPCEMGMWVGQELSTCACELVSTLFSTERNRGAIFTYQRDMRKNWRTPLERNGGKLPTKLHWIESSYLSQTLAFMLQVASSLKWPQLIIKTTWLQSQL